MYVLLSRYDRSLNNWYISTCWRHLKEVGSEDRVREEGVSSSGGYDRDTVVVGDISYCRHQVGGSREDDGADSSLDQFTCCGGLFSKHLNIG